MNEIAHNTLTVKDLGIDTSHESAIFLHADCDICKSEGFEVPKKIQVTFGNASILATLNTISAKIIKVDEAVLSNSALRLLKVKAGEQIILSHPTPVASLSFVREKIYNHTLDAHKISQIIQDITNNNYSDIELAAFLTACSGERLNRNEIIDLTSAMVEVGERLKWKSKIVVDKHCVGGLPGNRTTLLVVPIVAAFGLTIPKTSSRAITSPAGTADTMEVLAPVNLNVNAMRRVVEQENGCIIWGGSVTLSPADDILIRIERALNLDNFGQLVASILSKKIAAGATHVLIDMPIGPTAKIRTQLEAEILSKQLNFVAEHFNLNIKIVYSLGTQPVGRGIGPALEARDVLAVLQNLADAPQDLRERGLMIAGEILELSGEVQKGSGNAIAREILDSGRAWKKFQAICSAQGGMREIQFAKYIKTITAQNSGQVIDLNNRLLSKLATLAGAPNDKAAGIDLHVALGTIVEKNQSLFSLHAESKGELQYALSILETMPEIIVIRDQ